MGTGNRLERSLLRVMSPPQMPSADRRRPTVARAAIAALAGLSAVALVLAFAASRAVAALPQAHTEAATSVTYSSAVLNGSVNPRGQATEYFFQYGTTRKFGASTPVQPLAPVTTKVHVSDTITGLLPLTTYHFRVVATGASGATVAAEATFKTPKIPLSVAIVAVPNPVPYGAPYTVEGTLSGTGNANHQIMLAATPFPYTGPFTPLGNTELTNATGGFSFPVLGATENTQLRVSTVATCPPTGACPALVFSPAITEQVAVRVTLHVHRVRHGQARLSGIVEPAEVGALVGYQRLVPGHRTRNVGGTVVKKLSATQSRFSRVIKVHHGIYEAIVKINDGAHASGASLPVLIH
jgi:hypothetical protein